MLNEVTCQVFLLALKSSVACFYAVGAVTQGHQLFDKPRYIGGEFACNDFRFFWL